jgi:hypothetical protein
VSAPPTAASTAPPPAAAPLADPTWIRASAISSIVRFLSDDLLEGRFTASRGHEIATHFIAAQLQAVGAEPMGDGGTYFQAVPLRAAVRDLDHDTLVIEQKGKKELSLKRDDDFLLNSDMRTAKVDVDAPMVFVGYGVTAPEFGYDDLAGVDLTGKIAVVFNGAPLSDRDDFFPSIAHAVYGSARTKLERMAAKGAAGMISIFRKEDEERLPWARVVKTSRIDQMSWTDGGEPGTSPKGVPLRGVLHWKAFDAILAQAGVGGSTDAIDQAATANGGKMKAFPIPASAHGVLTSTLKDVVSHNVVGVIRGADPVLSKEYVVYSAHSDHLGISTPVDGDRIYNGALDNASGTASMLEIARAYSLMAARPARSILFLSCTGEERGLLGSEYFARFPTVPKGSIVADFNIDMVMAFGPVHDVVPIGAERSSLAPVVAAAAKSLGLDVSPDPEPKQAVFVRSDQFSFVREGIPSVFVNAGLKDEKGNTDARRSKFKQWIATKYHAPKDEWDPNYDYEGMAQVARVEWLAGITVADTPARPVWNPGDFLGKMFAQK